MVKIVGIVLGILMLNGCYTQFSTLEEKRQQPPAQISYEIDSASGDTIKVVRSVDTVAGTQKQNCYWTRNFLGQPELRCDNSMYGHDWYVYNDYPWWYRSEPYYYDSYGRCPRYYYYDAACGCCQYWGGGGFRDYNYNRGGGRGNSISESGGNGRTRQTSSSTVPSKQSVQQRQTQAKNAVNEVVREPAPTRVYQEPQIENQSRPEPAAVPRDQSQPSAPAAAPASNPPSGNSNPPSNSGGGSGDNGNRRNPRSW